VLPRRGDELRRHSAHLKKNAGASTARPVRSIRPCSCLWGIAHASDPSACRSTTREYRPLGSSVFCRLDRHMPSSTIAFAPIIAVCRPQVRRTQPCILIGVRSSTSCLDVVASRFMAQTSWQHPHMRLDTMIWLSASRRFAKAQPGIVKAPWANARK